MNKRIARFFSSWVSSSASFLGTQEGKIAQQGILNTFIGDFHEKFGHYFIANFVTVTNNIKCNCKNKLTNFLATG